jgi:hypothetical protein
MGEESMIRIFAMISLTGLVLGACAANQDVTEVDMSELDEDGAEARECAADQYQMLVGQPGTEVHTPSLPQPHRIYGEGDMVTMDYRPERLNVVIGGNGEVMEVKCG